MHICKVHMIKYYMVIKSKSNGGSCEDPPWFPCEHVRNVWLTASEKPELQ